MVRYSFFKYTGKTFMVAIFARINQILLFAILLVVVLYFGKPILAPLVFAAFLAMLMAPLCRKLEKKGWNRSLASLACVLILLFSLLTFLGAVVMQIASFSQQLPQIEEKTTALIDDLQSFVQEKFDVAPAEQTAFLRKQVQNVGASAGKFITGILGGLTTTIASILLTLVFTFLLIYNKEKYEEFFVQLNRHGDKEETRKVVHEVSEVSQQYLAGRALSILINGTMYAIGLSIVGVKNAVLLAGVAALLTLVPYIGTTLGGLFPVLMAFITEDGYQKALWAAGVLIVIQAIDNYFIEPNVVGGRVKLSALATILFIIIGGLIWGIPGMILFIPVLGIAKIVFDHVESLRPLGYVIGESDDSKPSRVGQWFNKQIRRIKGK